MGLYEELKQSDFPYSPGICRDLIRANRKKCGAVQPVTKRIIFFMLKRPVMKNTAMYMNIVRNRGDEGTYVEEDIVDELFLVLDRCLELYKLEENKDFLLYFNSAAQRRVRRIANYKKVSNPETRLSEYRDYVEGGGGESDEDPDPAGQVFIDKEKMNAELFWDFIGSLGEEERALIHAMNTHDKLTDRIEAMGVSRREYHRILKKVQETLKTHGYGI